MTGKSIPPSASGSFRSSESFGTMASRLGPFRPAQLSSLHEFHEDMYMKRDIGSSLEFHYGHNVARAVYRLSSPMSEGRDIVLGLSEVRTAPDTFSYFVRCDIDGNPFFDQRVAVNVKNRDAIPEAAFQVLGALMSDLNFRVFIDMPSLGPMSGGKKLQ